MARSLEELRKQYNSVSHGMSLRGHGPGRGPGPRGAKGKPKNLGKTISRLLSYVGRYKGRLALVFACMILTTVASLCGAFAGNDDGVPRVVQGSAWWVQDRLDGMRAQMRSFAGLASLGNFLGMLTDSRSFLSYPRHEYFRRILCELIGDWVENGEYPADEAALQALVEGVCYGNAKAYFNL